MLAAPVVERPAGMGVMALVLASPYSDMAPPYMKFVPAAPNTSCPGSSADPGAGLSPGSIAFDPVYILTFGDLSPFLSRLILFYKSIQIPSQGLTM
jgi:hypothetical protein